METKSFRRSLLEFLEFLDEKVRHGEISSADRDIIELDGARVVGRAGGPIESDDIAFVPVVRHGVHRMKQKLQSLYPELARQFDCIPSLVTQRPSS